MSVYICTDHAGHYPVGVASIIVADSEAQARELLNAELLKHGLKPGPATLTRIDTDLPQAIVLNDGDY